ncbi:hypothetical protein SELMODRAFT_116209 [Selaginella moellendorffii]|uniref:4-coumarate--CoA ligase n=1 Tax=Selaginella moellendorffii TaxID=88036 RepID=D8SFZ7_SELML|nr:hypothetical protein SELMODRAFT_116209 [Selaginella moellendorffii]
MADSNAVSLLQVLWGRVSPHKIAFIDSKTNQRISYGDLRRSVAVAASGMVSLGICPGDVVLIVLGNSIEFVVLFLGVLALGATVTTANPQNTVKDIQRQVADSRARFVFSSGSLASKIQELRLPMLLVGKPGFPLSHVSYEDLLDDGNSSAMNLPAKKKLSPAALLYSSGTTGVSKGVILSHGNLVAAMETLYTARKEPVPEDEVSLGMLPFFHIAGLIYGVLATIYSGTTMVVVAKFELLEIFETIERYKVTQMTAVPPMIIAFIKHHSSSKRYDLSSLSRVVCGAAPLGRETHEAFLRLYPQVARFPQAYGMTETTGVGFGASKDTVVGSAGKIMPGFEAKVVEVGTGRTLPPGSQGELCLRGRCIMEVGYLNNPKATSETIDKDGWLHTGDLVLLDTDGNMFVMDRLKELIKYKGFQVAPAELEALLLSHPAIQDCTVVPFPNEEAGEVPLAYVVRVPHSTLSEAEVVDFVSKQVAPYKRVRQVRFLDAIPKSATGKLLRRELIARSRSRL